MMQQGLASLTPPQGMAPGQAAPQSVLPQQQSATPQAVTGTLERLPPQQLLSMYNNPQDMTPKWAVATAYAKAIEQARLMQMAQGQSAMAQSAAQAQQPPVVQQIMSQPMPGAGIAQGFSGGGAVAFQSGGATTQEEQDRKRLLAALRGVGLTAEKLAAAGYDVMSMPVRGLAGIYNTLIRAPRAFGIGVPFVEAGAESMTPAMDALRMREIYRDPSRAADVIAAQAAGPVPAEDSRNLEAAVSRGQRGPTTAPQRAPRPGTGRPATTAAAPGPDEWAGILSRGRAGIAALQDVDRQQGEVDPELARLRAAAYESAQGIAQRRERDRLAALEAAQKAASAPLMDNQEALLRLAGSIGGKMRFGEALGAMAGAAGGIRGEQRKALEVAQRESRAEQNAIDQLNQALAEKRVADRSGDVDRKRAADRRVAEAQLKVTDLERDVQKTREGFDIERQKISAEEAKAEAAREANRLSRSQADQSRLLSLTGLEQNRLLASRQAIEKEHRENPRYKMIYTQAGALGFDKLTPEQQRQYQLAEADLQRKLREVEATISPTLNRLYQDLGLSRGAPTNVQRYDSSGNRITGG